MGMTGNSRTAAKRKKKNARKRKGQTSGTFFMASLCCCELMIIRLQRINVCLRTPVRRLSGYHWKLLIVLETLRPGSLAKSVR